jgi:alkanesulfonate monooxygenase SsuD/methylene tetrahydromethanopterin reductase-like flavin-dependent oxidoreductase (luciferase family)
MHLAVELPGDGWGGSVAERAAGARTRASARPDFDAYVRLARTAERGLFDFLLLAERPAGADDRTTGRTATAGGLEPITVLNALAAVTEHIGLAAGLPAAGREPYALARRIAALDQLSGGRAGGPAVVVPGLTVPRSPQGRPVVIRDGDDEAAEVVLLSGTRGSARPGVRVLARIGWALDDEEDAAAVRGGPAGPAGSAPKAGAGPAAEQGPGTAVFTGSASVLAARLDGFVQSGAVDGFLLRPRPAPGGRGLDAFVDRVVPLLQERGSLRTAYRGTTLREHLGLPDR